MDGWMARWLEGRWLDMDTEGKRLDMDTEGRWLDICMDGWLEGWIQKMEGGWTWTQKVGG